jgi:hypothetical protein
MCECVTLQKSNKSYEETNDNDVPLLGKEIILGGTSKETKYEELFTPIECQEKVHHHVIIQMHNERCDGTLCRQFNHHALKKNMSRKKLEGNEKTLLKAFG